MLRITQKKPCIKLVWVGHVAHIEEMRNAYKILAWKPERKRPLGILRCRWEDNIRMDLRETGWEGVDWIPSSECL
jgi:hypothetical protein